MKVNSATIAALASDFKKALDHLKLSPAQIDTERNRWDLWNWVYAEHAYADNHPRFNGRARLFPFDSTYQLYPCGTNDATMGTALKAIVKAIPVQYAICVQCQEENGETGTFIAQKNSRKALSPVFDSLAGLYPWMKENGWESGPVWEAIKK